MAFDKSAYGGTWLFWWNRDIEIRNKSFREKSTDNNTRGSKHNCYICRVSSAGDLTALNMWLDMARMTAQSRHPMYDDVKYRI